jgi:hypothetical protein
MSKKEIEEIIIEEILLSDLVIPDNHKLAIKKLYRMED